MKSIILRRFFIGTPTVLIQNGKILINSLKKTKLDINDLLEQCRVSGYFDISQIECALLEANGQLSILPKGEYLPVTISDMKLKPQNQGLCANVIIDGKIMFKNLKMIGKNETWLKKELKVKGYKELNDILLVTIDNNEKILVYEKNSNIDAINILE